MKQRRFTNRFLYRMVGSYTLVFGLILAALFGVIYYITATSEAEQSALNHQIMVEQPLNQVEKFVEEMDDIAYKAMVNQALIAKFAELRSAAGPGNHFDVNVMDDIDTASILAGLNRGVNQAWRLSAYNNYDDFISTGAQVNRSLIKDMMYRRGADSLMRSFRVGYEEAGGDPGYLLYPPQSDPWSGWYKSRYVSLIRPIMNVYSGDVVGIVEVQQNLSQLEEYLRLSEAANLVTDIYDQYDRPVLLQGGAEHVVVASATSELCGWTVKLLEPASVARDARARQALLLVVSWLAMTVVMAVVIGIIATRISRPLTELTDKVRSLDITSPEEIPLVKTRIDEIIALQAGFNQVLNSLTLSMDQEKKAFLLAMQAQMNPHFLYNVLSVINAVALEGRSDAVVAICANLSGMLRYASSFERGTATVKEEVAHTREYLELMKARYDHMFGYTIQVDPDLEEVPIPKLVIQPICENAFTHPFSQMEPPYRLAIRVGKEPGGWSVTVTDNGGGFEPGERQRVMDKANGAGTGDLSRMQLGGLGLASTVLRLKLMTKKRVVCDITDAQPAGSAVKITIYSEGEVEA